MARQRAAAKTSSGRRWSIWAAAIPADQVRYRELQLDTDDPINIQYTSGTTGNPKGATLTHHNILNNARAMAGDLGLHARSTGCASPCRCTTASGWASATSAASRRARRWCTRRQSFDPLATLEAIAEERCTSMYGVPTMFIAHARAPSVRRVRPHVAAHRDHGRRAVPGRGDEAGRRRDARQRDLHRATA